MASRDLDIDEDIGFTRKVWRAERIGWILMGAVIVAASLGLLGRGPLSKQRTASPDGRFSAEYDYFIRYETPTLLDVTLFRENGSQKTLDLEVDRRYIQVFKVQKITPDPQSSQFRENTVIFSFPLDEGANSVLVSFELQPEKAGLCRGNFSAAGGTPVVIRQWSLP